MVENTKNTPKNRVVHVQLPLFPVPFSGFSSMNTPRFPPNCWFPSWWVFGGSGGAKAFQAFSSLDITLRLPDYAPVFTLAFFILL